MSNTQQPEKVADNKKKGKKKPNLSHEITKTETKKTTIEINFEQESGR